MSDNGDTNERIRMALQVAREYGLIDGEHHKAWVIDQMVRALLGPEYSKWVAGTRDGEEGPFTYEWDMGIAP